MESNTAASSKSEDQFHSVPSIRSGDLASEVDFRRLYSPSLSQIQKHSEFGHFNYKPSPFNIRWIHGYNPKVGVINLNDQGSTTALYTAGNCAVLYNWSTNNMKILQGHKHMVTCIAADSRGKWLVTADSGPENVIIIWDSADCYPQKTIFSPHGSVKLAKVVISADAKYLLTLGYQDKASIYWWIWSYGLDTPHATLEVDIPRGGVIDMAFNPGNSQQFLLMTKHDIRIGIAGKIFVTERGVLKETNNYELKIWAPDKKMNPEHGRLTSFTFVSSTAQVLVATSRGSVLVFGYTKEFKENVEANYPYDKLRFIKVLKVEKRRINVIKSIDGVIVTGTSGGDIRFYDNQMKLLYWVHGFTVDAVKAISFNVSPRNYVILEPACNKICPCWEKVVVEKDLQTGVPRQKLLKQALQTDATAGSKPFVVRDFIVCTHNQGVGFVDFVTEKLVKFLDNKIASAQALSVHPEKTLVCIGYADGTVELLNYFQHKLFARTDLRDHYKVETPPKEDSVKGDAEITLPQISVTCLKYSPSGMHLACGLDTGELVFLHPATISVLTDVPHRNTSDAIVQIAFSCDSMTLALADKNKTVCVYKFDCASYKWAFLGKHRAHYKDITSVFFLPTKNENGDYKLLSLGNDRVMYKYKIVNYATTMTLSTVLGPRYEQPVRRMQLITRPAKEGGAQYLLFATDNVVGLQKMPLDGNPWKHVALLGHPIQIAEMCYREDSGSLFTLGAKDSCVYQWEANYRSVETTTKQGGGHLDPYYCLIENGRPGWLFHEIRDLFYYIQILCQGTFSPAMRRVKDHIPIDSLPDLMRALGYFPSEYEVENLLVEAKYKVYQRAPSSEINFEEFVKLYLNHRPALGDDFRKIRNAFRHFAVMENNKLTINREDFIEMLSSNGERFSQELSWYLLSILNGQSFEDRAAMTENEFSFLPQEITLEEFSSNILGIQDLDVLSEQYSVKDSLGSQQTVSSVSEDP